MRYGHYSNWWNDQDESAEERLDRELEAKFGTIFDESEAVKEANREASEASMSATTDGHGTTFGKEAKVKSDTDEFGGYQKYDEYGYGWGGGSSYSHSPYKSYFYNSGFDFSVSMETRVKQLIKTISGKELKLVQATGWGCDDTHFYYNPQDLHNASDDEVLGLIFHQLARELYFPKADVKKEQSDYPTYRHLIEKLEDLRSDKNMKLQYMGVEYYQKLVWQDIVKDSNKPIPLNPIPALDFLYNIECLANGDTQYSKLTDNFKQAIPHIKAYLSESDYLNAQTHYEAIKALYPTPTKQELQDMDTELKSNEISDYAKYLAQVQADRGTLRSDREAKGSGKGDIPNENKRNPDYQAYQQEVIQQQSSIAVLHKLLSSILKDNEAKRYLGRQQRGKLDTKSLHKLVALNADSGLPLSDRVFKKERAINRKRYAMSLLIDQSGSMQGTNIQSAFSGLVVLAEVFDKLNLAFEINGFDIMTTRYKSFFRKPQKAVIGGIKEASGGGTNDLQALKIVRKSFDSLPPDYQKAVFVLSDGDGLQSETKEYVRHLQTKYGIKVFGIGLGTGVNEKSLQRSYDKYAHIPNLQNLPNVLIGLVKEQFRRT